MRPQTLITLLFCAAACADSTMGTSTGNPAPDAGDHDARTEEDQDTASDGFLGAEGGFCKAGDKTDVALDDAQLGFSAEDVLAFAAGSHDEALHWQMPTNTSYGPESGEQMIAITLTHDGSDARVVQPDDGTSNGGEEPAIDLIGSVCQPWLELDVEVTVESSGGALDESFDAVLRTQDGLAAYVYAHPDPDMLNGSFTASYDIEGFTLAQLDLGITFTPFGASGSFGGVFEMRSDDAVSAGAGGGPFATFGRASCADGGFAVGPDDEIEIGGGTLSVADVIALAGATDSVELTWEDDTTTTSTIGFTAEGEGGCVQLNNLTLGDTTVLVYGALAMQSEDGRLDGEWNGRLEARADAEGQIEAMFMLQDKLPESDEPGANAAYGFPNDDITSFDYAGVSVTASMTSDGVTGEVKLSGYIQPDCATDPVPPDQDPMGGMGTPGCRGSDEVPIAVGTF